MTNSHIVFPGDITGKKLRTRVKTEDGINVEDIVMTATGAKGFQTKDAHATPKTSPLTISSTEIAITVPDDAIAFVYVIRGADMKLSEVTGMARYVVILDGNGDTLECDNLDYIYVKRDAGVDTVLHFYFKTI